MAIDVIQLKCKENKTRNHRIDLRPCLVPGLAWPDRPTDHNRQPASLPSHPIPTLSFSFDSAVVVVAAVAVAVAVAAAVAIVGGGFNVVVSFNKRKIFSELQQL